MLFNKYPCFSATVHANSSKQLEPRCVCLRVLPSFHVFCWLFMTFRSTPNWHDICEAFATLHTFWHRGVTSHTFSRCRQGMADSKSTCHDNWTTLELQRPNPSLGHLLAQPSTTSTSPLRMWKFRRQWIRGCFAEVHCLFSQGWKRSKPNEIYNPGKYGMGRTCQERMTQVPGASRWRLSTWELPEDDKWLGCATNGRSGGAVPDAASLDGISIIHSVDLSIAVVRLIWWPWQRYMR